MMPMPCRGQVLIICRHSRAASPRRFRVPRDRIAESLHRQARIAGVLHAGLPLPLARHTCTSRPLCLGGRQAQIHLDDDGVERRAEASHWPDTPTDTGTCCLSSAQGVYGISACASTPARQNASSSNMVCVVSRAVVNFEAVVTATARHLTWLLTPGPV